jgi:hypothetical protein
VAGGALFAEARDQYDRAIKLDSHSGVAVAIGAFITESPITIGRNLSITQGDGAGDSILVLNTIIGGRTSMELGNGSGAMSALGPSPTSTISTWLLATMCRSPSATVAAPGLTSAPTASR